jgi:hypothetical protein
MAEPDPKADYWDMQQIADYLGVKLRTVWTYRTRATLPAEDRKFGNSPAWRPATIITWNTTGRPGQGAGGGRPRKKPQDPEGEPDEA